MTLAKERVLNVCKKLEDMNFITEIEETRYSIKMLVHLDEYEKDSYEVRNTIMHFFKKEGYKVSVLGSFWVEVMVVDVRKQIEDCFKEA